MMSAAVLSPKYQIAVPSAGRECRRFGPGQKLELIVEGGIVMLVPVLPIEELRGILRGTSSEGIREDEDQERI